MSKGGLQQIFTSCKYIWTRGFNDALAILRVTLCRGAHCSSAANNVGFIFHGAQAHVKAKNCNRALACGEMPGPYPRQQQLRTIQRTRKFCPSKFTSVVIARPISFAMVWASRLSTGSGPQSWHWIQPGTVYLIGPFLWAISVVPTVVDGKQPKVLGPPEFWISKQRAEQAVETGRMFNYTKICSAWWICFEEIDKLVNPAIYPIIGLKSSTQLAWMTEAFDALANMLPRMPSPKWIADNWWRSIALHQSVQINSPPPPGGAAVWIWSTAGHPPSLPPSRPARQHEFRVPIFSRTATRDGVSNRASPMCLSLMKVASTPSCLY